MTGANRSPARPAREAADEPEHQDPGGNDDPERDHVARKRRGARCLSGRVHADDRPDDATEAQVDPGRTFLGESLGAGRRPVRRSRRIGRRVGAVGDRRGRDEQGQEDERLRELEPRAPPQRGNEQGATPQRGSLTAMRSDSGEPWPNANSRRRGSVQCRRGCPRCTSRMSTSPRAPARALWTHGSGRGSCRQLPRRWLSQFPAR